MNMCFNLAMCKVIQVGTQMCLQGLFGYKLECSDRDKDLDSIRYEIDVSS